MQSTAKLLIADEMNTKSDCHLGADTGLFTTSMNLSGWDIFGGDATGLFTTSMAPQDNVLTGAATGLYTTSMTAGHDTLAGEATGLFTTSMAPAR